MKLIVFQSFSVSAAFVEAFGYATPYTQAPELCVEIFSSTNSKVEIAEKVDLYLAKGAKEVWVVTTTM